MSNLESIVRPFQQPDSLARRQIVVSSQKEEVDAAVISWGSAGDMPAPTQIDQIDPNQVSFTVNLCKEGYFETKRFTDVLRIVQKLPDGTTNPDNYIDLDRPYQVFFEKRKLNDRNSSEQWTSWVAAGIEADQAFLADRINFNVQCDEQFNLNRKLP